MDCIGPTNVPSPILRAGASRGATITSNAVSRLTAFWMSNHGWGKFLHRFRTGKGVD